MGERTRRLTRHLGFLAPIDGDADLLGRFAAGRDEAAFAALVRRHGPMVLGVCRRILRDAHAADDAFQATFLVLARRAASLRDRALLANWLYGVAYRTALEARRAEAVRRVKETRAAAMTDRTTAPGEPAPDLRDVLDKELAALPDVYRAAVVLCDLEGLPRAEAASRLGWTEGTLSGRLARARALLAKRLARYGLSAAGVAVAAGAAEGLSGTLVESTARAAALAAAGEALAGVVPVSVIELSQGVVKAMYVSKLKGMVAGVMVAGAVAWTGAVGTLSEAAAGPQTTPGTKKAETPRKPIIASGDADRIAQLERERNDLLRKLADMEARLATLEAAQRQAQAQEQIARQQAEVARDELERVRRNLVLPQLNPEPLTPLPGPAASNTIPSTPLPSPSRNTPLPSLPDPEPIRPSAHPDPVISEPVPIRPTPAPAPSGNALPPPVSAPFRGREADRNPPRAAAA